MKVPGIIFHRYPSSGSCADACGQMDRQMYMTQLVGTVHNYANMPKNDHDGYK